ncbi:PP2C family protein-serine/threonine phosphatase [Streptomyces albidochromogenes]|uniref:PP2C family protein-serine/threonine phosphatase n=1 Tax=Streptomyces albidochromogenes TaxID=329524 RepID=A0ABW6FIU5_9ACTN
MSFSLPGVPDLPDDVDGLKALIEREVAALRADVRRKAEERLPLASAITHASPLSSRSLETFTSGTPGPTSGLPAAAAGDASCADGSPGQDPWACLCSSMSAIPVSAALLDPVLDESGGITDFVIRAGNHVRSSEWLEAPGTQVGQRFLEARPGAATSGLLAALASVFTSGRALNGLTVDYTEERHGRLRRAPLLYYAASCGDHLLTTWVPARSEAEILTLDAQHIASMGWGHWDLLSGHVTWSEGLHRIFRTDTRMPWSLTELCDAVLPGEVAALAELITAVLAGEEPAWTRIRFRVYGEVRTLDVLGRPVAGIDGRPWAVHLVARDLTPQMRSRRRLAETQRETERLRQQAEAERHIASVMREALLPTHSAELAELGLTVAAAYLPAEPDAAVGGDWYKCRRLRDGRALLAIGDAVGHGLDAVARMAQQRHALAGLAQTGASAGEMTTWLNELVCGDASAMTATMITGHVDHDRVLHWACAGHPPPLLRRGKEVSPLPSDHLGPLLGLMPGYAYETAQVPLRSGDLLLLYTDGVVERRGEDITEGIGNLSRSLAENAGLSPRETLDRIIAEYRRTAHDDDACLLAVQVD